MCSKIQETRLLSLRCWNRREPKYIRYIWKIVKKTSSTPKLTSHPIYEAAISRALQVGKLIWSAAYSIGLLVIDRTALILLPHLLGRESSLNLTALADDSRRRRSGWGQAD